MVESKDQAVNPQNSEQVLNSFHEWMVQQAHAVKSTKQAAQLSDASRKGACFPPSIAPEPSIKSSSSASPEHPIDPSKQANIPPVTSNRSSIERRVFRTVCGLLIAIVVAVVWQTYRDDQTVKLIEAWGHSSVVWLSAALGATQRNSKSAAQPAPRSEKTSQGLSTRKPQGKQLHHLSRRSPRLPERHRPPTNRLVLLCRCPRQLKYPHPSIKLGNSAPRSRFTGDSHGDVVPSRTRAACDVNRAVGWRRGPHQDSAGPGRRRQIRSALFRASFARPTRVDRAGTDK